MVPHLISGVTLLLQMHGYWEASLSASGSESRKAPPVCYAHPLSAFVHDDFLLEYSSLSTPDFTYLTLTTFLDF